MTDQEIIRAIKCCIGDENLCNICPFEERMYEGEYNCTYRILCAAYEIIDRQKKEIERLSKLIEL